MKRQFVFRTENIKKFALSHISEIVPDLEKPVLVTVGRYVNSKSEQQRNGFHYLCKELGEAIGMQAGEVKEIAKSLLYGWKTVEYAGIKLVMADVSSEKLNMKEYAELIDTVYRMGAEAGVILPELNR